MARDSVLQEDSLRFSDGQKRGLACRLAILCCIIIAFFYHYKTKVNRSAKQKSTVRQNKSQPFGKTKVNRSATESCQTILIFTLLNLVYRNSHVFPAARQNKSQPFGKTKVNRLQTGWLHKRTCCSLFATTSCIETTMMKGILRGIVSGCWWALPKLIADLWIFWKGIYSCIVPSPIKPGQAKHRGVLQGLVVRELIYSQI